MISTFNFKKWMFCYPVGFAATEWSCTCMARFSL